ncbi:MAG TPA: CDP-6-deoxy-delta-3,4-glucoseen reductase [Casimicrobiaceae bacterium]
MLLFVLLPWLPPRLLRRKEGFHLLIRPDNRIVAAREGETLLESALRDGIAFPFDCRNGGCGVCKCTIVRGTVDYGIHQPEMLTAEEKAAGKALACSATPTSDLELEYVPVAPLAGTAVARHRARVVALDRLAEDVMRVRLELPAGDRLGYRAGQYINVLLPGGEKRSFSFATAPHQSGPIELHIRRIPGGRFTTHVFEAMKLGESVEFEGPLGQFFLREDSNKPMLFVAGATGFAPVKSMLEHAFHSGVERRMVLYWGVRSRKDLYLAELPAKWAAEHANFTFVPVLSEPKPEDHWTGRTGLVHQAILEDYPDLSAHQLYACGSVGMVEAAHPAFAAHGLSTDDCFSDAFKLAPHVTRRAKDAELVLLGGETHG